MSVICAPCFLEPVPRSDFVTAVFHLWRASEEAASQLEALGHSDLARNLRLPVAVLSGIAASPKAP